MKFARKDTTKIIRQLAAVDWRQGIALSLVGYMHRMMGEDEETRLLHKSNTLQTGSVLEEGILFVRTRAEVLKRSH